MGGEIWHGIKKEGVREKQIERKRENVRGKYDGR